MTDTTILVITRDKAFRDLLGHLSEKHFWNMRLTGNYSDGMTALDRHDIVFVDLNGPRADQVKYPMALKASSPLSSIIILADYNGVEKAVNAVEEYADNHISKPFDVSEIPHIIKVEMEKKRLKKIEMAAKRALKRIIIAFRDKPRGISCEDWLRVVGVDLYNAVGALEFDIDKVRSFLGLPIC